MSHGLTRTGHGLLACFLACLLCVGMACCGQQAPLTPEEQASQAAKRCYEALYNGHPEAFLNGRLQASAMPQSYRQQQLDVYRQHAAQMEKQHSGVRRIDVSRAAMDSTLNVMQVFLQLAFGDNTMEEIVVPMVEHEGQWMMK
ncbi:MAG: hypothetical protein IJ570_08435 [Prevotella sp.]|nr:hypothetical protein [Prevotella sp.]